MCNERKRAGKCNIYLFCPKHVTDNPYYCSNLRLHKLTDVINTLIRDFSGRLLRISGGHRAPLKNNCEAVVEIPLTAKITIETLEPLLKNILKDNQINSRIIDTDECEDADVE